MELVAGDVSGSGGERRKPSGSHVVVIPRPCPACARVGVVEETCTLCRGLGVVSLSTATAWELERGKDGK